MKFLGDLKTDIFYVSGDVDYQDYWIDNNPDAVDTSKLGLNIKVSRFHLCIFTAIGTVLSKWIVMAVAGANNSLDIKVSNFVARYNFAAERGPVIAAGLLRKID
ncbi:MAG: hypothetical protein ACI965_000771 [Paraglaciecola sp.]|jgi:hypothetical protein